MTENSLQARPNFNLAVACDVNLAPFCRNEEGEVDIMIDVNPEAAMFYLDRLAPKNMEADDEPVLLIASQQDSLMHEDFGPVNPCYGYMVIDTAENPGVIEVRVSATYPSDPQPDTAEYEESVEAERNFIDVITINSTVIHELQHVVDSHTPGIREQQVDVHPNIELIEQKKYHSLSLILGSIAAFEALALKGIQQHPVATLSLLAISSLVSLIPKTSYIDRRNAAKVYENYLNEPLEIRARISESKYLENADSVPTVIDVRYVPNIEANILRT